VTAPNTRRDAPISGDRESLAERFVRIGEDLRELSQALARGGLPEPFEWVVESRQSATPTIMVRNRLTRKVATVVEPGDWTDE